MVQYVVRRLLQTIPILLILSIVLFALVNIVPGGPLAGQGRARRIRPAKAEILKRQFGLDQPMPVQYMIWLVGNDWMMVDADGDGVDDSYGTRMGILRGDFGFSYQTRRAVMDEIMDRLPNTVLLVGITLILTFLIAIPVGILSAVKQYSFFDITVTTFSFMGQSIPEFWLGLLLILVFYTWLQNPVTGEPLLPAGGMQTLGADFSLWDRIEHLILPVLMGLVGWVAWYSRFLRSSMLDVVHQDYIRTARSKGLRERRVLFGHALKNATIPLITMFALDIPFIFAGTVYVELLFSWPGMGRLYYQAATGRDYPVLMAVLIIGAVLVFFFNLVADVSYAYLDPRVRYD
ncbi:MAG: ABC transporter permease [Candidatus Promineifilaceae bacterium]|jgi:peptide/nickel transport system permease protein